MTTVEDDFVTMCSVGYGCGLQTVSEAYCNLSFFIEEGRLSSLERLIDDRGYWGTTIRAAMGDAWCDEQDALDAEYWESQND